MIVENPKVKAEMVYVINLAFVLSGDIPNHCHAIKDGWLYAFGQQRGRVERVEQAGIAWYVYYLRHEGRDR